MADKSSVLFLMITSFNQEPGGSPGYNKDESILPLLPDPAREALLSARADDRRPRRTRGSQRGSIT